MQRLILTCMLCAVNLWIVIDSDGNCVEIRDEQTTYPCTDAVKLDTGCWDENGETQLCSAQWEQK
jgi:hypothetical protein